MCIYIDSVVERSNQSRSGRSCLLDVVRDKLAEMPLMRSIWYAIYMYALCVMFEPSQNFIWPLWTNPKLPIKEEGGQLI